MLAIKVENLGKRYMLRHQRYTRLYDLMGEYVARLKRRIRHPFAERSVPAGSEDFWALRDLSFDVEQGERVAFIGHNGAGKSTLLKLLSRITDPTEGRISIKGRVSSLLEVGTGFHPDLTGRENIYLNAAILGMKTYEIRRNFDAIVDFAGVEKFLDTPVKRYSSGMYVRLAFAIAAHLNSEILIVDEVLAVGDMEFQNKCMGKMDEISHKEGRTILFVSHNMGAVLQLCGRVVCLEAGHKVFDTTDVVDGVQKYMSMSQRDATDAEWKNPGDKYESEYFKPLRFGLYDSKGEVKFASVRHGEDLYVEIEGIVKKPNKSLCIGYALYDNAGTLIYWTFHSDQINSPNEIPTLEGHVCLRSRIPVEMLNIGEKRLELGVQLYKDNWIVAPGRSKPPAVSFNIEGPVTLSPYCVIQRTGSMAFNADWKLA
ncbi:MAG: ATP-binding cassette domain-containing protein [Synergistaceae bacterium]|nr:ATP-binding cassette domain-containing protein [Synergistaceae bacterium]MBQ3449918.1 ATP-binding cassette domain-containing protein [Synergistaceae bacterium]MBQ3694176.1 ATP-binding cassette domain-containing protein [Synergistaceae bacterium]MBQ9628328.1 ATP-binding cassette domain-containing protein [Synergistaceae bacterium]MBR0250298.1 ATP-binding cassette domain-containing protein [Synergistaceae bacterium]